jgi:hypothetical protein
MDCLGPGELRVMRIRRKVMLPSVSPSHLGLWLVCLQLRSAVSCPRLSICRIVSHFYISDPQRLPTAQESKCCWRSNLSFPPSFLPSSLPSFLRSFFLHPLDSRLRRTLTLTPGGFALTSIDNSPEEWQPQPYPPRPWGRCACGLSTEEIQERMRASIKADGAVPEGATASTKPIL